MAANNSVYNTHDSWTNNLTEAKHPQTSSTPAKHKPSGLQGNPQYVVIGVVVAVVIVVAVVGIGVGVYMVTRPTEGTVKNTVTIRVITRVTHRTFNDIFGVCGYMGWGWGATVTIKLVLQCV